MNKSNVINLNKKFEQLGRQDMKCIKGGNPGNGNGNGNAYGNGNGNGYGHGNGQGNGGGHGNNGCPPPWY